MLSSGMAVRELDVPGVTPLIGAGVYYGAALSEAAMYRGQHVFVLGGANSAGQGALFFARYAAQVTLIVRKPTLLPAMSHYLVDRIKSTDEHHGRAATRRSPRCTATAHLERARRPQRRDGRDADASRATRCSSSSASRRGPTRSRSIVATDEQGLHPDRRRRARQRGRSWELDRDPLMFETSVPGIFAAGDVRANANRRIAAAVGEGRQRSSRCTSICGACRSRYRPRAVVTTNRRSRSCSTRRRTRRRCLW